MHEWGTSALESRLRTFDLRFVRVPLFHPTLLVPIRSFSASGYSNVPICQRREAWLPRLCILVALCWRRGALVSKTRNDGRDLLVGVDLKSVIDFSRSLPLGQEGASRWCFTGNSAPLAYHTGIRHVFCKSLWSHPEVTIFGPR